MGINFSFPAPRRRIVKTNLDYHDLLLAYDDLMKVGISARKEKEHFGVHSERYAILTEMKITLKTILKYGEKPYTEEGTMFVKRMCNKYANLEGLTHIGNILY